MNLNKRNVVLQAAVASAFMLAAAGAQAGITSPAAPAANATFASELFGTGSSATVLVNNGGAMSVIYTMGVSRTVGGGTFQATIALTGGSQFAVAPTAASFVAANGTGATCAATIAVRSGGAVADTQVVYDVTPTGTCTAGDTLTFATPNLKNAQSLATVATKIGVTVNLSDLFGALDTSGTHATSIAISAASLSVTGTAVTVTTTAPNVVTIDAIAQSSKYFVGTANATGSKTVRLGTLTYNDIAGSKQKDGNTDRVRVTTDLIGLTLTGNFVAAQAVASSGGVFLSTSAACAATSIKYATLNATTATFTSVPGDTTATNICMTVDGSTSIVPAAYTASATYVPAITTESSTTTVFNLATTALNAKTADVRNYLPKAAGGSSYTQFIRIINAGSVDAKITAIVIDDTTGVSGTETELITSLKKGASLTMDSNAIENKLGAISATARPRIRILGATDDLQVQAFLFSANGAGSFTAMMGTE